MEGTRPDARRIGQSVSGLAEGNGKALRLTAGVAAPPAHEWQKAPLSAPGGRSGLAAAEHTAGTALLNTGAGEP